MISIDGIVVVEGRDDKTALSRVLDANIFVLHGMTGANRKKIDDLKKLAEKNKIYLLTDPDYAGTVIRNRINKEIPNIINLYADRTRATKNGNVGIENMSDDDLIQIFKHIRYEDKREPQFLVEDMDKYNLNSRIRREILGDYLGIGYGNAKQFLKRLNSLNISREEVEEGIKIVDEMYDKKDKVGCIFGKFFPVHKGHINFIKYVSRYCKKLYVFVCEEQERDKRLFEKSKLSKWMSIQDRKRFVEENIKGYKNIIVLTLNEDGIESYPNGWENWAKRVRETMEKDNVKVDIVFTNEPQDVPNYKKYLNLEAFMVDKDRVEYNISSTKVRTDPNKYLEFIPDNVKEFLGIK